MLDTTVVVDGHTIRYLDSDSKGHTVILLHGLGGHARKWLPTISVLSKSFRVIAPDIIGYGKSDKPVTNYPPAYMVSFVKNFIKSAKLKRPHIVGASLGGHVAIEFAAKYQRMISKLVLVSPAGLMKHSTPALDKYILAALYPRKSSVIDALQLMEGTTNPPHKELVNDFIQNMKRTNAKMAFMSSLLCFKNDYTIHKYIKKVKAPSLLVWGHDDPIIPVSYAGKFVAAIPNCKFTTIPNCGHTPYVQYPVLFSDILTDFFRSKRNHNIR